MTKLMYYDSFENEYCIPNKTSLNDAPERYLPTYMGTDIYIETWYTTNGELCNVAYSEADREHFNVDMIRSEQERKHNCRLMYPVRQTLPKKKFDEYYNRFIGED